MIKVIKKDGTKEDFNVQKVVVAVNKSAYRALIKFKEEELDYICKFVEEICRLQRFRLQKCIMWWRALLRR